MRIPLPFLLIFFLLFSIGIQGQTDARTIYEKESIGFYGNKFIRGVEVLSFKDHVFYEKHEVLNGSREIYKVFTLRNELVHCWKFNFAKKTQPLKLRSWNCDFYNKVYLQKKDTKRRWKFDFNGKIPPS